MNRLPVSLALFNTVLVCPLPGQTSHAPYDRINGEPTFKSTHLNDSYKGFYSSIRAVDFRNFTFSAEGPEGQFSLKNGAYKHDDPNSHGVITLGSVYYLGDSELSQPQSALVLLSWLAAGGSSSQGGTALIFTVSSNRPRAIQIMQWDTHFQTKKPTDSFDPGTKTFVVRTAHYILGDAHCCVSGMDVITLCWDGKHFVRESSRLNFLNR